MTELAKKYKHKEREKFWQEYWQQKGTYYWEEGDSREDSYVIDTPPPTVSGTLHMGHVFSYTQADFIARFQRMKGKNVFYPMGFDDNGLPTERLVEKVKKVRANDLSREEFIELCNNVSEEARKEFRNLFHSTAMSVDWRQEYHTISDESRAISQLSFLDLFEKGRVYQKQQPMLWDTVDQTAIAQAEVEDKEMESHFNDIRFNIKGSATDEHIVIGTTRPEMIPACVAIFYHPDDKRYKHLKGKQAITPLFGIEVPIMEDDTVEPEKGTGIMMCCTFGDEADIEKWQKHKLPMRIILNKYGKIDFNIETTINDDDDYYNQLQGLKVKQARTKILEMLANSGDLLESRPIVHTVKCAERSGAALEIIPTKQWFIRILDQKDELKAKAAECNWKPSWMKTRIDQWIDGLSWDWCISRQRYFGVPFPIWYSKRKGEEGKVIIAKPHQLPVNPLVDLPEGYSADEVEPELDVMDTWATSSVSPQLSSKGINASKKEFVLDENRHKKLFPADLRPQAHEIIRTWAFYTIVKAHLHENTIPWKNLMISGWCLAPDKTKMSKSKGNVITPVSLIEEKGTDAVRYWASTSKLGTDTAFSEDLLKIGNKLVTKLFNASKFAAMQINNIKELNITPTNAESDIKSGKIYEPLDIWIISRMRKAIDKATKEFEKYEYSDARSAAEDFFWNDFCDNYLELVKFRTYGNSNKEGQISACLSIYYCLNAVLKLFAPFVPHITEEIYSCIFEEEFKQKGSIHARGNWPEPSLYPQNEHAEQVGQYIVELLELVRKVKSERNLSIKYMLDDMKILIKTDNIDNQTKELLEKAAAIDLKAAANTQNIFWLPTTTAEIEDNEDDNIAVITSEEGNFCVSLTFSDDTEKEEGKRANG